MESAQTDQPSEQITAGPASYYRMTRYIMAIACIGMGLWFGYDGFIGWPKENTKLQTILDDLNSIIDDRDHTADPAKKDSLGEQFRTLDEESKRYKTHSPTDMKLQKVLFFALPPAGILIIAIALYRSRGRYHLSGTTFSAPGHPPISLDQITHIDKRLWDRKGIAYLDFEAAGAQGTITLDDFIYDRPPTDEIFKRIENYLRSSTPTPTVPRTSER
jgi:hypothetical protein